MIGFTLALVLYMLGARGLYTALDEPDKDWSREEWLAVLAWPVWELAELFGMIEDKDDE